jgi:hypothetical protein
MRDDNNIIQTNVIWLYGIVMQKKRKSDDVKVRDLNLDTKFKVYFSAYWQFPFS